MGWSNESEESSKKGMDLSSKILLAIIACVVLIIMLICILLMNIQQNTYTISVNGEVATTTTKEKLLIKIDNTTYVNIEEFAKLVGYEYHEGEYKAFTIEEDKCYVQGKNETATFYLNDNKVCKLPVNELEEEYREYTIENTIKRENEKMYAPIGAIELAFNVQITENEKSLTILKLDYLVTWYDTKVKEWGYSGIADQSFENQKSLLYGYLIVKKENGLYKIIDNKNTKEIVSDKYTSIEFSENTQEFLVTNSLGQVGIINLDGTTKIEPIYESISVFDKKLDLYLIQKNSKYGVVKSGNVTIVFPEYDSIGFDNKNITNTSENQYLIEDTLIPVCKSGKWGAFDKNGNMIYKLEYDGFGCSVTNVEVDGVKKTVEPLLSIKRCNGVVVKKSDKYGVLDLTGNVLVPIAVESIYAIPEVEEEDNKYFMLYNANELNIIEQLIKAGLIQDTTNNENEVETNVTTNTIENTVNNNVSNENVVNSTTLNTYTIPVQ